MKPWTNINNRKYRILKVPFDRKRPEKNLKLQIVRPLRDDHGSRVLNIAAISMDVPQQFVRSSPAKNGSSRFPSPLLINKVDLSSNNGSTIRQYSTCVRRSIFNDTLPFNNIPHRGFHSSSSINYPIGWTPIPVDSEVLCTLEQLPPRKEILRAEIEKELEIKHSNDQIPFIPGNNPSNQKLKVSKDHLLDVMIQMRNKISKSKEKFVATQQLNVKGPLGELKVGIPPFLTVGIRNKEGEESRHTVIVRPIKTDLDKSERAMFGTIRASINNAVKGVTEGYTRVLKFEGIGYRALMEDGKLSLKLGYSHPILLDIPEGCKLQIPSPTRVIIWGIDKLMVTQFAAQIRSYRPPEPYKQKGVFVGDETIKKKESKR